MRTEKYLTSKAKKSNSFVSGAPGDEKIVHPGGRKNIFLSKKMMFEAEWSSKNIALSYDKFISDISSPCEREYHLGKHESWLLMERKARKLHWKKKTTWYESRKVEEKKISSFAAGWWRNKNLPGRCARNKSIFLLAELWSEFNHSTTTAHNVLVSSTITSVYDDITELCSYAVILKVCVYSRLLCPVMSVKKAALLMVGGIRPKLNHSDNPR